MSFQLNWKEPEVVVKYRVWYVRYYNSVINLCRT